MPLFNTAKSLNFSQTYEIQIRSEFGISHKNLNKTRGTPVATLPVFLCLLTAAGGFCREFGKTKCPKG